MRTVQKFAFALLFMLLSLQLAYSVWNETVLVSVRDQNGVQVEGADIMITYQNASGVTDSDGLITGKTSKNGTFEAALSNRVPAEFEIRDYKVKASTYYWLGETQRLAASPANNSSANDAKTVDFAMPFELSRVDIEVVTSTGEPASGAVVFIPEASVKLIAGKNGIAALFIPKNVPFTGSATFDDLVSQFNSSGIDFSDKTADLKIVLPKIKPFAANTTGRGNATLTVQIFDIDGRQLQGQKVNFEFAGKNYSAYTGSDGTAGLNINGTGTVEVRIGRYEYTYVFSVNATDREIVSLPLSRLLKITSVDANEESPNCYFVVVTITDSRPQLPIEAKISRYGPTASAQLKTEIDESGRIFSRICITEDTQIKVTASNKYETIESITSIAYKKPKPPEKIVLLNETVEEPTEQMKIDQHELTLSVIAILAAVALLAAVFLGSRYLSQMTRFVIEYLRNILASLQRKKRTPPAPKI